MCVPVPVWSINLFFCLFPYNFIFYSVPSKSSRKGGVSKTVKFQQVSWKLYVLVQKKKKRTRNYSQKDSQLKTALQPESWQTEAAKVQQKDGYWEEKSPETLHRRSSLQIALYHKMKFTGNQALVPSLTKLRAVPLSPAYMWKFLLTGLKPSHWNTCLFLFGICVVFCRLGLGVSVFCLFDWLIYFFLRTESKWSVLLNLICTISQGTSLKH